MMTLFVGTHSEMLAYGREHGIKTRDLVWARGGASKLRGVRERITIVFAIDEAYPLSHREMSAVSAAEHINRLFPEPGRL